MTRVSPVSPKEGDVAVRSPRPSILTKLLLALDKLTQLANPAKRRVQSRCAPKKHSLARD